MAMPGWQVIRDFIDVLSKEGTLSTIYRGQPNTNWGLVPSLFREGAIGIGNKHQLYKWRHLAVRFAPTLPDDNIEWLVLAQHYGLATPLLDWTTSPLVALYFACDDEDQAEATGAVWVTSRDSFQDAHHTATIDAFNASRGKPFLVNAVGKNPRSTAQESLMSLHTADDYMKIDARKIFQVEQNKKADTILTLEKLGFASEKLHFDITNLVSKLKRDISQAQQ